MSNAVISSWCSIRKGKVCVNGETQHYAENTAADLLQAIYSRYGIGYPKFYKMDSLSALAFLTAELMLKNIQLRDKNSTGIVIGCKSASLDTDLKFQETIKEIPSPGLFVYTLPNIMLGEISIRHGLKGEQMCSIGSAYDITWQFQYVRHLVDSGFVSACVCGWVELLAGNFESFLYLVENRKEANHQFDEQTVNNLFNYGN